MKKLFIISVLVALFGEAFSQVELKEAQEYISVPGGVQNVDKKVLKDPEPQCLPYVAIKFRTASVETFQEGSGSNHSRGRTYAMLSGVDSTLFQEITNEFSELFTKKLTDAGITFVDFEKIKNSKLYKERLEGEQEARNFNHKNYGTADVFTQDHRMLWYYPVGGLKGMKFCQATGGGAAYLRLTLDFVEFDTDISKSYGYDYKTTTFSANAFPTIKVTSDNFAEGTWNAATNGGMAGGFVMQHPTKLFMVNFMQNKPIYIPYEGKTELYDDKIPKFAKKPRVFGGAMELGTFVIEANREAYKKAAMEALTKYADYAAAIVKSYAEGTESKSKNKAPKTR